MAEGPETRVPWIGEHTDAVLQEDLGLTADEIAALRADGVLA
jgi:crotonobetainyl-CoA:carnitine CoA-transferase CaiB-like acyl-CoA transferase